MSGDYSRFSDRPRRRYSGVLMQQGRVQLDADWNEHVDIARRRWERQAEDTFGQSAVPRATTPGGFAIATVAGGDLSIGAGRIYVDGKLAELFSGETVQSGGTAVAVSYLHQPFYPDPPALPTGGGYLVWLDVWDREVTWIEDPDLLEKALGGPDTTTRRQTVWQVKAAPPGANAAATCGAPAPKPSGGRLSTQAVAPPPSDDPCILSPSGGYRGLENRLYRLEVHVGGALAAVRFKWSRENASVASTVTQIGGSATATTLVVSRIGRDSVLRFAQGDWIEVTDDVRELMGEAGEMAQVSLVDEASRTVTLDRQIPAAGNRAFGANSQALADRHTRIRLWNQTQSVGADGLLGAGGLIGLEDGVQVQLTQAGSDPFAIGDYWVFAARTVDGSVETLDQAEPRGIRHHYCQLATVTAAGTVDDCRRLWPETCGCCCTAEVGDGTTSHGDYDDLVAAVRELGNETPAGTPIRICLLPGNHQLSASVVLARDQVTIRGCGRGAPVSPPAGAPAFVLSGQATALEDLQLVAVAGEGPAIVVCEGRGQRIERVEVATYGAVAILATGATDLAVTHCRLSQSLLILTSFPGSQNGQAVNEAVRAAAAATPTPAKAAAATAATTPAAAADIAAATSGLLVLDGPTVGVRIVGNEIGPGLDDGIVLANLALQDVAVLGNRFHDLVGSGIACRIGSFATGLDMSAAKMAPGAAPMTMPAAAPMAAGASALAATPPASAAPPTPASDLLASNTTIDRIYVPAANRLDGLRIEGNTITACVGTQAGAAAFLQHGGIVLARVAHVEILDNQIEGNGTQADPGTLVAGIHVQASQGLIVRGNVVVDNGLEPDGKPYFGLRGGILALDLSVLVDGFKGPQPPTVGGSFLLRADGWPAAAIQDNLVVAPRGQALRLTGLGPMTVTGNRLVAREMHGGTASSDWIGAVFILNVGMSSALVAGLVTGGLATKQPESPLRLIEGVTVSGQVEFADNQVALDLAYLPGEEALAAIVVVTLDDLAFHDNQVDVTILAGAELTWWLPLDTLAAGATVRANGNGLYESRQLTQVSLLAEGFYMATAGLNQAAHCIVVHCLNLPATADVSNLSLQCNQRWSVLRFLGSA